jgi:hypothetical protein
MLFKQSVLDGIASGAVDLAFRSWRRPTVKVGTQLRTAVGVVEVDAVDEIGPAEIPEDDVHRAGFPTRDALLASLRGSDRVGSEERVVYRIELHLAGPDPRIALRQQDDLGPDQVAELRARLERLDQRSHHGPWTLATLRLIADHPATRAGDLAAKVGRPRDKFKTDVRKLKELGLTESLDVGYRLSPRGHALLHSDNR